MNYIYNMDLNLLRLFLRVYECGSVTEAAQQLSLTQPAVSHGLKRLRAVLGDPLFVRNGHRLIPTSMAAELFPHISEAFALIESSLVETGSFEPKKAKQQFHLAMTDYVEALALPTINAGLASDAPGISLKISELNERRLQESARVWDLMIARLDVELPPDFYVQKLWQEEFVTVCASNHQRIKGRSLSLDDFLAEKHILVGTERVGLGAVDRALAALGKARNVQIATGFFLSPIRVAATSDLIATVPRRLAEQARQELPVKIYEVPLTLDPFHINMAWSPRRHKDPAHKWFRGWVQTLF